MISKVLIANRGEIALRIIAACREAGLATVAVHSEADRDSLHVRMADEKVCIGPAYANASYLNITAVIAAAEISGADAIHPGYGFLAENAHFAEIVQECGLTWIGPPPEAIRAMGDKANARRTVTERGVPVLPGSSEPLASRDEAVALAEEIGFPVILKASAGGGGKGMRVARDARELRHVFETARHEAEKAFGVGDVYLEKYLTAPRHIEIQVMADAGGRVVALGERECSIQRRHQKLIEEAPSHGRRRRAAGEDVRGRGRGGRGGGLRERRHRRVPLQRRRVLLHGDEHPDPGRAPGDRGGDRRGPA